MKPQRFRKKPVEIEAMLFDGTPSGAAAIVEWCKGSAVLHLALDRGPRLVIKTLEGEMTVTPGDWVIEGVKGEHYPCKPDIFEATYEVAE